MANDIGAQIDALLKKRGSPMAGLGSTFVAAGKKYGVDPRLVVSISGIESGFGKHTYGDFNAWGWGPGIPFGSWADGIATVTRGLYSGYISQGLKTPAQIVSKYAPGSDGNDEGNWSSVVAGFMRQLGSAPATTTSKRVVVSAPPSTPTMAAASVPSLMRFTPTDAGLRGAVISNLSTIGSRGYLHPSEMLGNILQGSLADRTANEQGQAQVDAYNAALRAAVPAPVKTSSPTPTPTKPTTPSKDSPTLKTTAGYPVPSANLERVSDHGSTAGIPGFSGADYMAPSGSAAVAPIAGKVVRLSGRDPADGPSGRGGALGWSVYIRGTDGRVYYLTHMGSRDVAVGDVVKLGQQIGTVANWHQFWGTPDHIHMGVGDYLPG